MIFSSNAVKRAVQKAGIAVSLAALSAVSLPAQTPAATVSSSADYRFLLDSDELGGLAPAPAASQYGGGQYGGGNQAYQSRWSHLAFEAGGGFTAPVGNDRPYVTWGGNFTVGAGWSFNRHLAALAEWQFNDNKIPGATLSASGFPGGNVHTWSLTIEPTYYYANHGKFGGYVFGGGGFYRKLTSFTEPELFEACGIYYCEEGYENVVVSHFSSNQGGLNIGTGITYKMFGADSDSKARLYAETRYVWVDSPTATATTLGTGTEGLIPVTVGIRW
jgi:hypothetical protein